MAYSTSSDSDSDSAKYELRAKVFAISRNVKKPASMLPFLTHHELMVENNIEDKPGTFDILDGDLLERIKNKKYGFDYMIEGLKRLKQQRSETASFYERTPFEIWSKDEDLPSEQFQVDYHMSAIKGTSPNKELQKHAINEAKRAFCNWYKAQMEAAQKKHSSILALKLLLEDQFRRTKEEVEVLDQLECAYFSFKEYLPKDDVTLDQKYEFFRLHKLEIINCKELLMKCIQSRIHGSKVRNFTDIIKVGEALSKCDSNNETEEGRQVKRIVHQVDMLKKIKAVLYILRNTIATLKLAKPLTEIFSEDENLLKTA